MSAIQTLGLMLLRVGMVALTAVVILMSAVNTWATLGFAWNIDSRIGLSLIFCLIGLGVEVGKATLAVLIYNTRIDAPKMAEWYFGFWILLAIVSYGASMAYAMSGDPSKELASALFITQVFSSAGTLALTSGFKWITETQMDGVPRQIMPAPMQHDALPGPSQNMPHQHLPAVDSFAAWVNDSVNLMPGTQMSFEEARASLMAYVMQHGYPQVPDAVFAADMEKLVFQHHQHSPSEYYIDGAIYHGVSLMPQNHIGVE